MPPGFQKFEDFFLPLVAAAGDREAEGCLPLMLGLALRESFRPAEAKAV